MALQNLDIRDENGNPNLTIDLNGTPAERGGGDSTKSYCGVRASRGVFTLENPGVVTPIALDTVERNEKNAASTFPITIKDAGFYVYGFDITLASNVLYDNGIFARISGIENAKKQVLIKEIDKAQDEFFADYRYFLTGETLEITLEHTVGIIGVDYLGVFAFRLDEPDAEPKGPCIKNYFRFDGDFSDDKVAATLIPKNGPSFGAGAVNQAVQFDGPSLQGLSTVQIDPFDTTSNPDGFTLSAIIQAIPATTNYLTIAAKWKGSDDPTEDQFHFYYDRKLDLLIFAVRFTNGTYDFVTSKAPEGVTFDDFLRVSATWNPVTKYLRLYINNHVQATKVFEGLDINTSTTQAFTIGAYNITANNFIEHSTGDIDELLFCCREYTNDDINELYNEGVFVNIDDIEDDDGNFATLPVALSNTTYNNFGTGLSSTNGQDVITELKALIDGLSGAASLTYTAQFSFLTWTLNPGLGRYEITILGTTHMLNDPGIIQFYRSDPGEWVACGDLNVTVDATTQDITFGVNDVPDARFAGRINVLSMS